ncbi:hypothetical protein Rsub_07714 [Raphidocelis subcapitata]|uniref:Uncharacterized protein n=1 Tax=Raphidocelis subcapitata TaxID=307507 RepID=A0A2V0PB71_9CHLO|nr:hypothetical protein Rsub_07714 [Raphidocelis subcapitata]|eukprot:GBF95130.1 hypothetical protein Rsub_07714 [Raphidocelis subcapitata]
MWAGPPPMAAALELLRRQPSLLLFSGTDWEEKPQLLGAVLGLAGGDARPRLLEAVAAAPNLLTRSPAALQASWVALRDALGKETARQVLLGAEQGPAGGAPRLLAYSAAALSGRAATLQQLSELSADWRQRVDAARRKPAALAAVLGAREGASGRLAWLVASGQRLAPGGVGLPELLALDDAGFADIYPLWHAREGAGAA